MEVEPAVFLALQREGPFRDRRAPVRETHLHGLARRETAEREEPARIGPGLPALVRGPGGSDQDAGRRLAIRPQHQAEQSAAASAAKTTDEGTQGRHREVDADTAAH